MTSMRLHFLNDLPQCIQGVVTPLPLTTSGIVQLMLALATEKYLINQTQIRDPLVDDFS